MVKVWRFEKVFVPLQYNQTDKPNTVLKSRQTKQFVFMKNFINLTPHDITIQLPNGERITYPKSGQVVRVSQNNVQDKTSYLDLPAYRVEYGEVTGLPPFEYGTTLIVSGLVLAAVKDRPDLVAPLSDSTAIRNTQGQIEAVTGWVVN